MRSAHKLRSVPSERRVSVEGRYVEGHVVAVEPDGKAKFRDDPDELVTVRIPRHVDRRWLAAAVALAPVPAIVLCLDSGRAPVLAHVFAAPEHAPLDEQFRVNAKTIELSASESVHIRTGKSIVTVTAAGEIQVRGKNILSRASNVNRVRGGAVRIN
jgi:hypothetical protein